MNVVRHATHAISFAAGVSRHRRKIGMQTGPNRKLKMRESIFRAENDVDDNEAEGLRHDLGWLMVIWRQGLKRFDPELNRAVGPSDFSGTFFLGRCPRLALDGPLALNA